MVRHVMEMHLRGVKRLVFVGWAGRTLSASHELLSRARASIANMFERSKNAAITLACWAIEPLAKREMR